MNRRATVSLLAISLVTAISGASAEAAPSATIGGTCTKAGAVTTSGGKSFTCIKALSGKLVWNLTSLGAKPQISGVPRGGDGGPGDDHGGFNGSGDVGRQTALKKYNACLVAHGGTAAVGVRPPRGAFGATPLPPPSLSAAQSKAVAACATLAPKFPPRGGDN